MRVPRGSTAAAGEEREEGESGGGGARAGGEGGKEGPTRQTPTGLSLCAKPSPGRSTLPGRARKPRTGGGGNTSSGPRGWGASGGSHPAAGTGAGARCPGRRGRSLGWTSARWGRSASH